MSSTTTSNVLESPATPRTIFEYEVIDLIGEGAGSLIYAVSDTSTRQIYALKHVVRKTEKQARFIEQLQNEYAVGSQVNHANLRKVVAIRENRTLLRKVTEAALVTGLVLAHYSSGSALLAVAIFRGVRETNSRDGGMAP